MEERYRAMSRLGVRNLEGYNARVEEARRKGEVLTRKVQTGFDPETGQPIHEEEPFDQIGEHTSELQSLMRISYAVFCLKKQKNIVQYASPNQHYIKSYI